jgi:hypothetical protein
MMTCLKTGWGTRQNGAEVSLTPAIAIPHQREEAVTVPLAKLLNLDGDTLEIQHTARHRKP